MKRPCQSRLCTRADVVVGVETLTALGMSGLK